MMLLLLVLFLVVWLYIIHRRSRILIIPGRAVIKILLLLTDSMYEFTSGADHKVIVYRTDDELKAFVCFRTMAVKLIISHQYIHQIRDDVWDNVYPVSSIYWLQH